ncbi:MAG: glycosyltransferase, partial [Nitrososphaerales archaeon]
MGASSRLRMLQYIESGMLGDARFEIQPLLDDDYLRTIYAKKPVSLMTLLRSYGRRLRALLQAGRYDLLWIEKELFPNLPSWGEWWLARAGIPYVVDYDDAIFHNYDTSPNPLKRLLGNKIGKVMRHAAMVVPGNPYLADHAAAAGARRIEIVPTVIDLQRYTPGHAHDTMSFVIGWIGSPSSIRFLHPLLP